MIEANAADEVATPTAEQLAREYGGRVLKFAAMVCANPADSEDLAQEALLKAMRGLSRFDVRQPASIDAWLWRIVVNAARDAGRAASRRHAIWERLAAHHQPAVAEDVESFVLRRISDADLLDEVRRLPQRYRTLLALRFGGDLSYEEIGQLVGDTPGALRQAARRALQRLHAQLEEKQP